MTILWNASAMWRYDKISNSILYLFLVSTSEKDKRILKIALVTRMPNAWVLHRFIVHHILYSAIDDKRIKWIIILK